MIGCGSLEMHVKEDSSRHILRFNALYDVSYDGASVLLSVTLKGIWKMDSNVCCVNRMSVPISFQVRNTIRE